MNTHLIGSLVIAAGLLTGCASSHEVPPAASPETGYPGAVVRYPDGDYVLRGDGTTAFPHRWEWVQRPRASSPAPEAPFAPRR